MRILAVTLAWAILCVPLAASAASFDCAKATRRLEKLICADPELSRLDEVMATVYGESMQVLSPKGQENLRFSQKSWLNFINTVLKNADDDEAKKRLWERYDIRIEELTLSNTKVGKFTMSRADRFWILDKSDEDGRGTFPGFYFSHVAVPCFDTLETGPVCLWKFDDQAADFGQDYCDARNNDYEGRFYIVGRSPTSVVFEHHYRFYCHGARDGLHTHEKMRIVSLSPMPRVLDFYDFFENHLKANKFIEEHLLQIMASKAWDRIRHKDDYIKIHNWRLSRNGIVVMFDYFMGKSKGSESIEMSWRDLQPILAKDVPLPAEWLPTE